MKLTEFCEGVFKYVTVNDELQKMDNDGSWSRETYDPLKLTLSEIIGNHWRIKRKTEIWEIEIPKSATNKSFFTDMAKLMERHRDTFNASEYIEAILTAKKQENKHD